MKIHEPISVAKCVPIAFHQATAPSATVAWLDPVGDVHHVTPTREQGESEASGFGVSPSSVRRISSRWIDHVPEPGDERDDRRRPRKRDEHLRAPCAQRTSFEHRSHEDGGRERLPASPSTREPRRRR
jgi:hypothetical protein